MNIGIPKEIKNNEYRVALTPEKIAILRQQKILANKSIYIETSAGVGSGFSDEEYTKAGGIITDKKALFSKSDLIIKVKEPLPEEFFFFQEGQTLFTFLHLAANPNLQKFLLSSKITGLSYDTLFEAGEHPILLPMSEVAGRMAPLMASFYLQKSHGGIGILPSGIPGTATAHAVVLGAGIVGKNAARICQSLGMETIVLDIDQKKLRAIDDQFQGNIRTLYSSPHAIAEILPEADLLVGAVYVHGERTPILVTEEMVKTIMKKGSVIVDVSVDQGGCIETIHPTTHENPVYEKHGVIHYGVANMPGAFPRTSTIALGNATFPYILKLIESIENIHQEPLQSALNTVGGKLVLV